MTRYIMNTAAVAIAASIVTLLAASAHPDDDPGRQTLLTMLVVADLVEAHADPTSGALEPTDGLVRVDSLRQRIRQEAARYFEGKDRWGSDSSTGPTAGTTCS